ncbi:hypothetical protein BDV39DRAFT_217404 [Aspergillus sergii]|uniref:LysM domain-containing protein n=1 Tax=Aspergillus sergii TaxID=1034303 RepID=A0A5N6WW16_9EURO|nr:hypothetical protein BDV39DRAFT_217404 [Aspergillus sergii]
MKLSKLSLSLLAPVLAGAYLVTPPGTVAPDTTDGCSKWVEYSSGLTCSYIENLYGMTEAEFEAWNPIVTELGDGCSLISSLYYCVQVNYTVLIASSFNLYTSTSISSSIKPLSSVASTASSSATSTPTPYETGIVHDCDAFHYVVAGDTCASIASTAGITTTLFETWNPNVGSGCSDLGVDYYVCVGIVGSTASTTTTQTATTLVTSTSTGNGVTTPAPFESAMVSNCDKFYYVVDGDSCASIASAAGISLTDLDTWNPLVNSDCSGLWLNYYDCVGIIGRATSTTASISSTTTSSGNGVTTPTPYETGMVDDCTEFHMVVNSDGCTSIADAADITITELEAWNLAIGSNCSSLWLGYYVCIGV